MEDVYDQLTEEEEDRSNEYGEMAVPLPTLMEGGEDYEEVAAPPPAAWSGRASTHKYVEQHLDVYSCF